MPGASPGGEVAMRKSEIDALVRHGGARDASLEGVIAALQVIADGFA